MTEVHLQDAAGPWHAVVRPVPEALGHGRRRLAVLLSVGGGDDRQDK